MFPVRFLVLRPGSHRHLTISLIAALANRDQTCLCMRIHQEAEVLWGTETFV